MWQYGITQSQHCSIDNYYNDDNVMHASAWFEFFGGLVLISKPMIYMRERDKKEWDLNWEHPFPRVSRYKTRSDIKEVDITEFKVYIRIDARYVSSQHYIQRWIWLQWAWIYIILVLFMDPMTCHSHLKLPW